MGLGVGDPGLQMAKDNDPLSKTQGPLGHVNN